MASFKHAKIIWSTAIVLAAVIAIEVCITNSYTDCRMSDETFKTFLNQPVQDYVDADMMYADEEKAIFYYLNGIFVYNYNEDRLEQMIDLEKLNCAINQLEPTIGISVHASSDGKKLALYNYGPEETEKKFDNYIIYIKTGIAKKEAEPDIGMSNGPAQILWAAEIGCWRSGSVIYTDNEEFYLELDDGAGITQLKLVAMDRVSDDRREFYPFNEK